MRTLIARRFFYSLALFLSDWTLTGSRRMNVLFYAIFRKFLRAMLNKWKRFLLINLQHFILCFAPFIQSCTFFFSFFVFFSLFISFIHVDKCASAHIQKTHSHTVTKSNTYDTNKKAIGSKENMYRVCTVSYNIKLTKRLTFPI